MIVTIAKMTADVRVAMDMNSTDSGLFGDFEPETLGLDDVIRSVIPDAATTVLLEAPLHLLEDAVPLPEQEVRVFDDGHGEARLPEDFLRLVRWRMSDWERPVTDLLTPADPRYAMQFSRCPGLRGNPQKPVAALVRRLVALDGTAPVLEFWSCRDTGARLVEGLYVRRPAISAGGEVEIPIGCYRDTVRTAARLASAILGESAAQR